LLLRHSLSPFDGDTGTAVTFYPGQFVPQPEKSIATNQAYRDEPGVRTRTAQPVAHDHAAQPGSSAALLPPAMRQAGDA
jgi:hypothetical protein